MLLISKTARILANHNGTLGPDKIPAERSVFMFSPMSHAT
jgi:hypothetical protein